jgi:hypothetical protein
MANKRIYFATHAAAIKGDGGSYDFVAADMLHGLQSAGVTSNFNITPIFTLGQLETYDNVEEIPEVEVSLQKVLDGYPLIYHHATQDTTTGPTLANRSTSKCMLGLAIYEDTNDSAIAGAQSAPSIAVNSGLFVGSLAYNFGLDGAFTEDVTLVGNHQIWKNQPGHGAVLKTLPSPSFDTDGSNLDTNDDSPIGNGGVNTREDMLFDFVAASGTDVNGAVADPDATILPFDVEGITNSGTNEEGLDGSFGAHLSSISVSADLSREPLTELGRRLPYTRNINFPIQVTTEISATSRSGTMVSFIEEGVYGTGTGVCVAGTNLQNRTIRIATCEGTRIYLGKKNKLSGTSYSGGDAGGGNVTATYTYINNNIFTVMHSGESNINASAATWWTQRGAYLVD